MADVEGLAWAGGLTWVDVEGLDLAGCLTWAEIFAEVLIGVEVEGSLLISKSTSVGRVTISVAVMSGTIGFRMILMPDLRGNVSDGAVGWGKGIKKPAAHFALTDMVVICGNLDTIACITMAWSVSSIKI